MGRFHDAGKLVGGNQRYLQRTAAGDDHDLVILRRLIAQAGEVFPSAAVGSLNCHKRPSLSCTILLYNSWLQVSILSSCSSAECLASTRSNGVTAHWQVGRLG